MVTTHHLEEAEFCENVIMMHLGKIVVQGSPEEIRERFSSLPLFEIETSHPLEIFNLLESEPWISEAAVFGGIVHIYAETSDPISSIEQVLKNNRVEKYTITKAAPTLEDIFINANKS